MNTVLHRGGSMAMNWMNWMNLHLADAFIQSDLHCIQVTVSTFYQVLLSLAMK